MGIMGSGFVKVYYVNTEKEKIFEATVFGVFYQKDYEGDYFRERTFQIEYGNAHLAEVSEDHIFINNDDAERHLAKNVAERIKRQAEFELKRLSEVIREIDKIKKEGITSIDFASLRASKETLEKMLEPAK